MNRDDLRIARNYSQMNVDSWNLVTTWQFALKIKKENDALLYELSNVFLYSRQTFTKWDSSSQPQFVALFEIDVRKKIQMKAEFTLKQV